MTVEKLDGQAVLDAVHIAIEHHGASREELIPILSEVNRALGYLPVDALAEISAKYRYPEVSSFLSPVFTKCCRQNHAANTSSSFVKVHLVMWQVDSKSGKAYRMSSTWARRNQPDGNWTLITTSCLGVCAVGPVFLIDDDIIGNVTPEQVPKFWQDIAKRSLWQ